MVGVYMGDNDPVDVAKLEPRALRPFLEGPEGVLAIPSCIDEYVPVTAFDYVGIRLPRDVSGRRSLDLVYAV